MNNNDGRIVIWPKLYVESRSIELTATVFPIKYAHFFKIKNIPDLLSDDKEGKVMWNNDF